MQVRGTEVTLFDDIKTVAEVLGGRMINVSATCAAVFTTSRDLLRHSANAAEVAGDLGGRPGYEGP